MCELSNDRGSNSESQSSWEDGDIAEAFTGKDFYQKIISQSNKISIVKIIRSYNIKFPHNSYKITCPFKSHKGGRERTPSFQIFSDTNSFYCHGCSTWGHASDFVSKMDGIGKVSAAYKILSTYDSSFDDVSFYEAQDSTEKLQIVMNFTDAVRNFRNSHFDKKSEEFIEHICVVYDRLYHKHRFDNESLRSMVEKFLFIIKSYTPCFKV